ncbi:hypothetical protein BDA99DRAFT_567748 [Phascolomyces articulosus]|uniref:F-box domain-containing protein n=1 Tax=Phascolomyces articulosus TaxID=60185 RepID=A0AAD5PJI8_9FUNG|nr:hypothetical protein BDA99DRAFT_567748 [Phascolomyces articulosus]
MHTRSYSARLHLEQSRARVDFTKLLPYEVLCQIFTYGFTHEDYISFVNVSRSWRREIPIYSKDSWRDVTFRMGIYTSQPLSPPHELTCYLGHHVRRVLIINYKHNRQWPFMSNLLKLLIAGECMHIEKLVFEKCLLDREEDEGIILLLHLLGRHVVELIFSQHESDLFFVAAMAACPKLEQFSYSVSSGIERYNYLCVSEEPPLHSITLNDDHHPNDNNNDNVILFSSMTCLSIDATIAHRQRLKPILMRCPNLRVLRIHTHCRIPSREIILTGQLDLDLKDILSWCPALEYLECNTPEMNRRWNVEKWMTEYRQKIYNRLHNTFHRGLRTFVYFEGRQEEYRTAIGSIKKHAGSLETLVIGDGSSDAMMNWDSLESIIAPNIQMLKLHHVRCSESSLASFIGHCQVLWHLVLDIQQATTTGTYGPIFRVLLDPTPTTRRLRHLTIHNYKPIIEEGIDHHTTNDRGFKLLSEYLQSTAAKELEELCITGRFGHSSDYSILFDSLSKLSRLRSLEIYNRSFFPNRVASTISTNSNNENSSTTTSTATATTVPGDISYSIINLTSLENLVLKGLVTVNETFFDTLIELKNQHHRLRTIEIVTFERDATYGTLPTFLKCMMPFDFIKFTNRADRRSEWEKLLHSSDIDLKPLRRIYSINTGRVLANWSFIQIHRDAWEPSYNSTSNPYSYT